MRIFCSIGLTLTLLIGTYYYTAFADSVRREPIQMAAIYDEGSWRIGIFRTLDCVPDHDSREPALLVRLKNQTVYERDDVVPATEEILIADVREIERGMNELYVAANLATIDNFDFNSEIRQHAIRVVVTCGDSQIADESFWLQDGDVSIYGTVLFEVPIQSDEKAGREQD